MIHLHSTLQGPGPYILIILPLLKRPKTAFFFITTKQLIHNKKFDSGACWSKMLHLGKMYEDIKNYASSFFSSYVNSCKIFECIMQ